MALPRRGGRDEFLDIFSGVGHVAAHARKMRYTSHEFETRHGIQGDVLRPVVQAKIKGKIRQKRAAGVMLATPCTSFTTARNRTRVPIRSKKRPRGLTHYAWANGSERQIAEHFESATNVSMQPLMFLRRAIVRTPRRA